MNTPAFEQAACRPSMKERQRMLREEAILDAAEEFLNSKGFNAMTLEDITESIGISRPTLYQHFSSKEDILIHVAIRNLKIVHDELRSMSPNRSATDRLKEFLSWSVNRKFGPSRQMFYDITRLVLSCGGLDPRFMGPQDAFMKDLELITLQAQEEGGVRSDIRAMLLAQVIVGAIKNVSFDRLVEEGQIEAGEIADGLVKLLFCEPATVR